MNRSLSPTRIFRAALFAVMICFSLSASAQSDGRPDTAFREDAVALLATYSPAWTDIRVPVILNLSSPASLRLSGTAVMTRDGGIHLSFRFLGFEAAALQIDGDSIRATYKLKKRYVAESINSLLHGFPATVGNLQHLLLGQVFAPGKNDASVADFTICGADDADLPRAFIMMPKADLRGIDCAFVADGGNVPHLMAVTAGSASNQAVCIYSDPVASPAGQITPQVDITGSIAGKTIDARLTFDLSKAVWNTGATLPAINTKGYTRMSASSLLRSLSAF